MVIPDFEMMMKYSRFMIRNDLPWNNTFKWFLHMTRLAACTNSNNLFTLAKYVK